MVPLGAGVLHVSSSPYGGAALVVPWPETSFILNQPCNRDLDPSLTSPSCWHWKLLTSKGGCSAKPERVMQMCSPA